MPEKSPTVGATDRSGLDIAGSRPSPLPGLAVALAVALVATAIERVAGRADITLVSAVFVAVVGGMAIREGVGYRTEWQAGLQFAAKRVLKAGIVLLGLRFGISEVVAIGGSSLVAIAAVVAAAFGIVALLTRAVGIEPRLGYLIGVGTAICGNSAIIATAPIIDAREEEISFASATITLFGMVAMVGYPLLGLALGLDDQQFGMLAGAGVHDSAQAIASGFIYSPAAGGAATIVKLTRTAFLIPVVVITSWVSARASLRDGTGMRGRLANAMPWFALGFVLLALSRSAGDFLFAEAPWWGLTLSVAGQLATFLIVVAMAAVGLGTDLRKLRAIGLKPFYVGFAVALTVGALALGFAVIYH